jgi:hypothetical protein
MSGWAETGIDGMGPARKPEADSSTPSPSKAENLTMTFRPFVFTRIEAAMSALIARFRTSVQDYQSDNGKPGHDTESVSRAVALQILSENSLKSTNWRPFAGPAE